MSTVTAEFRDKLSRNLSVTPEPATCAACGHEIEELID